MTKYLNRESISRLWTRTKSYVDNAVSKVEVEPPDFYLDLTTGKVGIKGGKNVSFKVIDGKIGYKVNF